MSVNQKDIGLNRRRSLSVLGREQITHFLGTLDWFAGVWIEGRFSAVLGILSSSENIASNGIPQIGDS